MNAIIPQPTFGMLLSIQLTVLNNQGNDYRVARPRGVLATTGSMNTLNSSPRRLSTWDGGQSNDISRPPLHAGERQWWRIEPSLVIWLRLTPHAGELRGSVFSSIHDRRLQRSSPLTWQISKHSQREIVRAEPTRQRQLACHRLTSI
jgi:hypothetical protein